MTDMASPVGARLGKALLGCIVAAMAVTIVVDLLDAVPGETAGGVRPASPDRATEPSSAEPPASRAGRPRAAVRPAASQSGASGAGAPASARTVVLRADSRGHFWIDGAIDGTAVRFIIDTGASGITLGPDTARAAGLRLVDADFTQRSRTANGIARTAPVTIRNLGVGPVRLRNMPAHVTERPMPGMALLGMSFLGRLEGYEVRGDKMTLRW